MNIVRVTTPFGTKMHSQNEFHLQPKSLFARKLHWTRGVTLNPCKRRWTTTWIWIQTAIEMTYIFLPINYCWTPPTNSERDCIMGMNSSDKLTIIYTCPKSIELLTFFVCDRLTIWDLIHFSGTDSSCELILDRCRHAGCSCMYSSLCTSSN